MRVQWYPYTLLTTLPILFATLKLSYIYRQLIKDPSTSFDTIITALQTMDVQKGCIYFSSFYVLAEILAIPAVPILTASSGYLFGTVLGTATCLFSASIAASISFVIGRTFLRYVLLLLVSM